jgi:hypothetical protein
MLPAEADRCKEGSPADAFLRIACIPPCSGRQSVLRGAAQDLQVPPEFPVRFGIDRGCAGTLPGLFRWCTMEHRHSGIELMPPGAVHYGCSAEFSSQRGVTVSISGVRRATPLSRRCAVPGNVAVSKQMPSRFIYTSVDDQARTKGCERF